MEHLIINFDLLILVVLGGAIVYLKYLESPRKRNQFAKSLFENPIFMEENDFFSFKSPNFKTGNKTTSVGIRILAIILIIFVAVIPLEQFF
ncbi:hypothetical protein SAMN04489761_3181 [Tenacibaculum sp. MAR_2009_124]|uniref:hypothetical protein n=1 Tax=Tenacibaculum sp. MAR_2009_124 TaxID=1250059 RepID=UPI0008972849|nr:hypothetical protein [Tenacibaculum sp. MAR_2009_124]SEC50704.1 hypothetical protein SAMN04489761_3181 [Tenacibaculum sp. MAR_2009_124]